MRNLILLRHAKAVRGHEAPTDEARGLADRGRHDAAEAGAALLARGLRPDTAFVSSAARTRETFAHAGLDVAPQFESGLYHAAPEQIWDYVAQAPEGATILIVGHNPGLGDLAAMLVAQAHDRSAAARDVAGHFPTAAWAAFEIKGDLMRAAGPRFLGAWKPERD